jgi:S-adenosylmethionine hydrolase
VIASRAPAVRVDDAGHDVPRGDVAAGAAALGRYWQEYPERTVHVAVVDPGVGGARAAIVVSAAGRLGVGPDNGVLTPMLVSPRFEFAREVRNADLFRHPVSDTFHGRDVFAPVAAYLAQGGSCETVGPEAAVPVRVVLAPPERSGALVWGAIGRADRFGNLSTNLPRTLVAGCGGRRTFAGAAASDVR